MLKSLEGARLGIFVFIGTVLIIAAILLIGNRDSLFVDTITVKTYFTKVEGLKTGAPVRLSGYDIGSVSDLSLVEDSEGKVLVEMRIEESVKNFIRLDSRATIASEGLVGKNIVSITPGNVKYEVIKDGGFIKSKDPVNIQEIIEESRGVMANLREVTEDFAEISSKVNEGTGTVGKIFNDDELYYAAVNLTKTADQSLATMTGKLDEVTSYITDIGEGINGVMENVDSAVVDIKQITHKINNGEGALGALLTDESVYDSVKATIQNVVETSEYASQGAFKFVETMEALKHNWLFKSYFENRGYWDAQEYEKKIDSKLDSLKTMQQELDRKIEDLKKLNGN